MTANATAVSYLERTRPIHVALLYRNSRASAENRTCCHIGLGVNTLHTVRVLTEIGVVATTYGVWTAGDVAEVLAAHPEISHAVIEAPWLSACEMRDLLISFPGVRFTVRCHSQIGFLQVEAGAISLMRQYFWLQEETAGFEVSSNSRVLSDYVRDAYGSHCAYLPNLYHMERPSQRRRGFAPGHLLKISSFGATRLLKNHTTAAAAAQVIARKLGCHLEFHISVNREENGKGVIQSLRNMYSDLPWAKLVEVPWARWSVFRHVVGSMDLGLQPSFTETFNITIADHVAEGVACVVSPAIAWAPKSWHANPDDCMEIAGRGIQLLLDPASHTEGQRALRDYMSGAVNAWREWLQWLH